MIPPQANPYESSMNLNQSTRRTKPRTPTAKKAWWRYALKRWAVVSPDGAVVSEHFFYRVAFWAARGHTLSMPVPRLWRVQRIR